MHRNAPCGPLLLLLALGFIVWLARGDTPVLALDSRVPMLALHGNSEEVEPDRLAEHFGEKAPIEAHWRSWKNVSDGDFARASCVFLAGVEDELDEGRLSQLEARVRAGQPCVASADVVRAAVRSPSLRRLLGIESVSPVVGKADAAETDEKTGVAGTAEARGGADADRATRSRASAVDVLDQRHAITQSLTAFLHTVPAVRVELEDEARVLAASVPWDSGDDAAEERAAEQPRLWLRRHGRGLVAATTLDASDGASRGLVRTLLARAVEWSAPAKVSGSPARWLTTPLAGEVVWAAEKLGADDTGIAPGLEPRRGTFRGRQIANYMLHTGAPWLTRPEREREEQPERVLDSLEIEEGDVLCDLGAGNGYFTLRMARRVGPAGKVYAVDIQQEMLDKLAVRQKRAGLNNIIRVLGTARDPNLPADSIDLTLLVDVYHELSHPAEVMGALHRALRDDGRVVLVEYRGEDPTVQIKPLHRMTEGQARAEMRALGFRWLKTERFLPTQHVLVFQKVARQPGLESAGASTSDKEQEKE